MPLKILLDTMHTNTHAEFHAELRAVSVPTLILHGDADASAPIDLTGRKTAALIPGSKLVLYKGAGHGFYASEHARISADLIAFMGAG